MALNGETLTQSFQAGEDLSDHQYKAVYLSGDQTVRRVSASTQMPIGILQNSPGDGGDAVVAIMGATKAIAGGALERGDLVYTANGKVVKYVLGTTTGKAVIGQVIVAAGADTRTATIAVNCATPSQPDAALT